MVAYRKARGAARPGRVLNGCRSFLPQLRAQPRGWLVNLSSLFGVPGQTAPERVADAIVGAIEDERHRVLVCPETVAFDWLRRLAPGLGNQAAAYAIERSMGLSALRRRLR